METYVYAFDLALNSTGVCIFSNDGDFVEAFTIDTTKEKSTPLKLKMIAENIENLTGIYTPSVVVIEQGFSLHNKSTQAIFRVHGVVNYLLSDYEQIYYQPSLVKKVVTGKGNAKKSEVRGHILLDHDVMFHSMDESDAFALGLTYFQKRDEDNAKKNDKKHNNIRRKNKKDK